MAEPHLVTLERADEEMSGEEMSVQETGEAGDTVLLIRGLDTGPETPPLAPPETPPPASFLETAVDLIADLAELVIAPAPATASESAPPPTPPAPAGSPIETARLDDDELDAMWDSMSAEDASPIAPALHLAVESPPSDPQELLIEEVDDEPANLATTAAAPRVESHRESQQTLRLTFQPEQAEQATVVDPTRTVEAEAAPSDAHMCEATSAPRVPEIVAAIEAMTPAPVAAPEPVVAPAPIVARPRRRGGPPLAVIESQFSAVGPC